MVFDVIFENILIYFSYPLLFGILAMGGIFPIFPEELLLLTAGYIVFLGIAKLSFTLTAGFLGIVTADCIGYYVGHRKGRDLLLAFIEKNKYRKYFFEKGEEFFKHYGDRGIIFGRFFMGIRFSMPILAGAFDVPWKKFIEYDILGASVWATATIGGGYLVSYTLDQSALFDEKHIIYAGFVVLVIFYSVWRFFTHKEK